MLNFYNQRTGYPFVVHFSLKKANFDTTTIYMFCIFSELIKHINSHFHAFLNSGHVHFGTAALPFTSFSRRLVEFSLLTKNAHANVAHVMFRISNESSNSTLEIRRLLMHTLDYPCVQLRGSQSVINESYWSIKPETKSLLSVHRQSIISRQWFYHLDTNS